MFVGLVQKLIQQMNNGPNFTLFKGDKCEPNYFSQICLFNFKTKRKIYDDHTTNKYKKKIGLLSKY